MQQKSFATFDIIFHVNLMRGLQRYARNLIFMMAFGGQTARYIKNCCCAYGLDWLCYPAGSSKDIVRIKFLAYFCNPFIKYRISANSCRDKYSFFELWVRQLIKGDNYSREITIFSWFFVSISFFKA